MNKPYLRLSILSGVICLVTACSKGGQNGGTSTDVGGGGSGIEAVWKEYANTLEQELRLLVATPLEMENADFDKIKAALPALLRSANVRILGYPLLLGVETAEIDNPSGAAFENPEKCSSVLVDKNLGRLRDAINFPSRTLIKVSEPRLLCYVAHPDQMRRLVLHEYLGLLGFTETEDGTTNYKITNAILEAIRTIQKFEDGLEVRWVRTCPDFERIGEDVSQEGGAREASVPLLTYKLANDIDCNETEFRNENGNYRQKFLNVNIDGNGYTVRGLTIKGYSIEDMQTSLALFAGNCSHCLIANLRIENIFAEGEALLFKRNSGQIANVAVLGKLKVSFSSEKGIRDVYEAGGLIRENLGVITDVNAMIEVDGLDIDSESQTSSRWIGGIAGSNYGNISRSSARTAIMGSGNLAGFVAWNSGSVNGVVVRPYIEGTDVATVGGFAAYNEGRVEKILAEGSIGVFDQPDVQTIAGGLIAVARSKGKSEAAAQLVTPFPFRVGKTSADVSICGRNLNSAPLIAKYDGHQDARSEVADLSGLVYQSYGFGKLTDACAGVP